MFVLIFIALVFWIVKLMRGLSMIVKKTLVFRHCAIFRREIVHLVKGYPLHFHIYFQFQNDTETGFYVVALSIILFLQKQLLILPKNAINIPVIIVNYTHFRWCDHPHFSSFLVCLLFSHPTFYKWGRKIMICDAFFFQILPNLRNLTF